MEIYFVCGDLAGVLFCCCFFGLFLALLAPLLLSIVGNFDFDAADIFSYLATNHKHNLTRFHHSTFLKANFGFRGFRSFCGSGNATWFEHYVNVATLAFFLSSLNFGFSIFVVT
jgi:hypothetical protein